MSEVKVKKETILNTLFECREERLYALTEKDKEKIATLTKDNDSYEKLFSIIEKLPHTQEELDNIRNSLDSYIDKINIVGAYENENFYKIRIFRCNHFDIRMCYSKIEIARVYCSFLKFTIYSCYLKK